MTARVLVVDDLIANVKLLEIRLTSEYFDVTTAMSGAEALRACEASAFDIVLLDVMMPGMDGFEVCRRLKENPATHHIPVVMVTALDQPSDRVRGLEAGADDFLTKPVEEIALISRVKSLVRMKMLTDELRARVETSRGFGLDDPLAIAASASGTDARLVIVDDRASSAAKIEQALRKEHQVEIESDPHNAIISVPEGEFDAALVSLTLNDYDGLRLCSQLRSLERTRNMPIIAMVDPDDDRRLLRAMELGVNDYVSRPIDRNELVARIRTQVKRRRYAESLRQDVRQTIEMAVTDSLTGLHNRRYLESHLRTLIGRSLNVGKPLSLLALDVDHFKAVNDTYGHGAGDRVLQQLATRMKAYVRDADLACRSGGEEFVIVMPEAEEQIADGVAERLRAAVAGVPFIIDDKGQTLYVTISAGLAQLRHPQDSMEDLLHRADAALYRAKGDGRNRIIRAAA